MVTQREHHERSLGRGPAAPAWVIGLVIVAVVGAVAIGVAIRMGEEETTAPASPAVAQPSVVVPPDTTTNVYDPGSRAEDLDGHVLLKFKGPAAKGFETYPGSGWTAGELSDTFGLDLDSLYDAGLIDAYGTAWFNDWGSAHGQDLVSVAMIFETNAGAADIFEQLRASDQIAGMDFLPNPKLGDGSYAWRGMYEGRPTIAYVWYFGDEVAILASQGSDESPALAPSVMRELAKQVQGAIAWDL